MKYQKESINQELTQKCLHSIVLFVNGFHRFVNVPKGNIYNSIFIFCNTITFSLIDEICSHLWGKSSKSYYINLDNAWSHHSKQSIKCFYIIKGKRIQHLTSNSNLVPNNFFLFGYIKLKLREYNISNWENLRKAIINIFNEIGHKALIIVFEEWI
jgi:hypothetical protein